MKPSIPKGTRDFSPEEVAKRNYIFNTIKQLFEKYGFQPIETPSFENSDTLMGKYGEEGDRLIFKILNSGDYLNWLRNVSNGLANVILNNYQKSLIDSEIEEIKKENLLFILEDTINMLNKDLKMKIPEEIFQEDFINCIVNEISWIGIKKFVDYSTIEILHLAAKVTGVWLLDFDVNSITKKISEKALRYDLTVPFARYVVQHQNEIEFPFKRYQMQPVWRADRPQKGRFREFYQCDADVVGSNSLWQEVEFVQLYDEVFTELGLTDVTIKLNNRKILSGIAEMMGAEDKLIDFTVALDKLDKIGEQAVIEKMLSKGITEKAIEVVKPLFRLSGANNEKLASLKSVLKNSTQGKKGVEDLEFVIQMVNELQLRSATVEIDVTLARGLNYYTGAIFEVKANKVNMGSIGGGGRYDDLTGIFGLKDIGGIGISFGLDRIYLVLEELGLFKTVEMPKPKVLFLNFGDKEALYCMRAIKKLRESGIKSELYPDNAKVKKQLNYANRRNIPFVVFVGENEIKDSIYSLKNMVNGEQKECNFAEMLQMVNHE